MSSETGSGDVWPQFSETVVDSPGHSSSIAFTGEQPEFRRVAASLTRPSGLEYRLDVNSGVEPGSTEDNGVVLGPGDVVSLDVHGGADDGRTFDVSLMATHGQTLQEGRRYVVARDRSRDLPGVAVFDSTWGGGCGTETSWVDVERLDLDRREVHLQVHLSCGRSAWIGEVRVNMPRTAPLDVAPTAVQFLDEVAGELSSPVPVLLENRGSRAVDVEEILVVDGDPAFGVGHSTCANIPAGGWCRVWLQYRPGTAPADTGAVLVRTSAGTVRIPVAAELSEQPRAGELYDDQVDGRHDVADELPSRVGPGTPSPPTDAPGHDWLLMKESAQRPEGARTFVWPIDSNRERLLDTWSIPWFGRISGDQPWSGVDVRIRSDAVPHAGLLLSGRERDDREDLVDDVDPFVDHVDCDPREFVARVLQAEFDRAGAMNRFASHGRAACQVDGATVTFHMGADAVGTFDPAPPVMRRTELELLARPRVADRRERVRVVAVLRHAETGSPVRRQDVTIQQTRPVRGGFRTVATVRTGKRGRAVVTHTARRDTRFRAAFAGSTYWAGDGSPSRRLRVRR